MRSWKDTVRRTTQHCLPPPLQLARLLQLLVPGGLLPPGATHGSLVGSSEASVLDRVETVPLVVADVGHTVPAELLPEQLDRLVAAAAVAVAAAAAAAVAAAAAAAAAADHLRERCARSCDHLVLRARRLVREAEVGDVRHPVLLRRRSAAEGSEELTIVLQLTSGAACCGAVAAAGYLLLLNSYSATPTPREEGTSGSLGQSPAISGHLGPSRAPWVTSRAISRLISADSRPLSAYLGVSRRISAYLGVSRASLSPGGRTRASRPARRRRCTCSCASSGTARACSQ